jgi:ribosome biogenesis protein SSF1/2
VRKILSSATGPEIASSSSSRKKVNLSSAQDIADYLLRNKRDGSSVPSESGTAYTDTTGGASAGWDSGSETEGSEAESDSNAVDLPEDYVGRGNKKGERRAVRLVEVGPRMELRLVKIAEGLVGSKRGEGETVFHEFGKDMAFLSFLRERVDWSEYHSNFLVSKSKAQASAQQAEHDSKRKAKDARRKQQEANVARKQAEKDAKEKKSGKPTAEDDDEEEEDAEDEEENVPEDVEGFSDYEDDEFEYEDRVPGAATAGEEDDEVNWDEDVGDVSDSEDEEEVASGDSESEEEPASRPKSKRRK